MSPGASKHRGTKTRPRRREPQQSARPNATSDRALAGVKHPHRAFMTAAIKAMLESRSENPKKKDPLVGAVLVFPDGTSIEAHRGNWGTGDHGEFSLLEKSGARIPAGSTLYVTLEPCSKRGDGKTPCADRILDARIPHVVIGIRDPNPDIYGRGEEKLKRENIQVDFFDEDLAQQIRDFNSGFLKEQEERAEHFKSMQLKSPSREENRCVAEASADDFSVDAIRAYLKATKKDYKVPSTPLWSEFKKLGFLSEGNSKKDFIPTVAGLVLFAARPHVFLPQCRIKANVFVGSPNDSTFVEKSKEQLDITGPLFTQVTAAKLQRRISTCCVGLVSCKRSVRASQHPIERAEMTVISSSSVGGGGGGDHHPCAAADHHHPTAGHPARGGGHHHHHDLNVALTC